MIKTLLLWMALLFVGSSYAQQDSAVNRSAELVYFQVQPVDKVVLLKWAVQQTGEFKAFDIERSENGSDFIKVGSRLALSKSSESDYDFVDATPKQNIPLQYRLQLIYLDGTKTSSPLKEVRVAESPVSVLLKQNPVRSSIDLAVTAGKSCQATVAVIAYSGQQVTTRCFHLSAGANQLSVSSQSLLPGIYQLVVEAAGERKIISFSKE